MAPHRQLLGDLVGVCAIADLSDVEKALVTQVAKALVPDGSYAPGTLVTSALANSPIRIYRGWPQEARLDVDLLDGICNISVFPSAGMARNSTRWLRHFHDAAAISPTFTAELSGNTITFGGTASKNQVVGISVGSALDGAGFTYRLADTDTPDNVAAIYAADIPGASAVGAVLTVPGSSLYANVITDGVTSLETRRQEQLFRISVWAPTPSVRDRVFGLVDAYLSDVRMLALPNDTFSGPVWYRGGHVDDVVQKENLWLRHGNYAVDYPTVITEGVPRVLYVGQTLTINQVAPHGP